MKKTVVMLLLALLWTASAAVAAELKVGDKAPDFKLKDSTGKEYSLASADFEGKVISIFYVDPDEKDRYCVAACVVVDRFRGRCCRTQGRG